MTLLDVVYDNTYALAGSLFAFKHDMCALKAGLERYILSRTNVQGEDRKRSPFLVMEDASHPLLELAGVPKCERAIHKSYVAWHRSVVTVERHLYLTALIWRLVHTSHGAELGIKTDKHELLIRLCGGMPEWGQ